MLFDGGDDSYCQRACAMLLVSGDNIETNEFTRLFGVSPTEVARTGSSNGWRLSSESQLQSANLERHIHWILDQIADKREVVKHLKQDRNCQVDLGCWWKGHPTVDECGPILTPETLRRVAEFDLNLIFYFER